MKGALQSAFEAPEAIKKDAFLKNLNYPKTRYKDFFISQIGYIRKRVWWLCIILVLMTFTEKFCMDKRILTFENKNLIWIIAATLPFLALISVTEISRSYFFRMEELEMSCRYSLSDLVIARVTILGIVNALLLISVILVVGSNGYGFLRVSLYLVLPYLMTCFGSILVLNHVRGIESLYYCGAVAGVVSATDSILSLTKQIIYNRNSILIGGFLCVVFMISIFVQMQRFIKRMEEIQWNLLLTD